MPRAFPALALLLVVACERAPLEPAAAPLAAHRAAPGDAVLLPAGTRSFTFTTIEFPGALATTAWGINARGDVVGSYVDADGAVHGFLLSGGVFTTVDRPGADGSQARGIGPNGDIVGIYWDNDEPAVNVHGFLRTTAGDFLAADYPGHINTIPQRLLPDGTIVGCRHDTDMSTSMRGVVMGPSGNREITAFASMHNGATPDLRRIAGLYTNTSMSPARTEGYLVDDGVFTAFLVPGSTMTAAWDVAPSGDVVGVYRNSAGFHGFLLTGVGYVTIDVPGAAATRAFGINARGEIVGSYVAGGITRGFVARPEGGR